MFAKQVIKERLLLLQGQRIARQRALQAKPLQQTALEEEPVTDSQSAFDAAPMKTRIAVIKNLTATTLFDITPAVLKLKKPAVMKELQELREKAEERPKDLSPLKWPAHKFAEAMLAIFETNRSDFAHILVSMFRQTLSLEDLNHAITSPGVTKRERRKGK
jgi:hypothetical protein